MAGASDGSAPKGAAGKVAAGAPASPPTSDEDEKTFRKPLAIHGPATTSGLVPVIGDDDDESVEETRVQGQPPNFAELAKSFVPVGDADDTGGTAETVTRTLPDAKPAGIDPPKVIPAAGRAPDGAASAPPSPDGMYGVDDSVTAYGHPVEPYQDDSVTADSPPITRPRPVAPVDDSDGVTERKYGRELPKLGRSDSDDDSAALATAVMVSPLAPPESQTPIAVSLGPITRGVVHGMRVGAGVAAARAEAIDGVSDSGLRLTEDHFPSGAQVRVTAPLPSGGPLRHGAPPSFGAGRGPLPSSSSASHDGGGAAAAMAAAKSNGPVGYADPRSSAKYDFRLVIVAFVSFAIPFGLFLYLYDLFDRSSSEPPRPAEVVSDPTPMPADPARSRAGKPPTDTSQRHR